MQRIYEKYKLKEVTNNGYTGTLVGFSEDRFLLAANEKDAPSYSFRRLDKGSFVEEAYKERPYKYWYLNEATLDKLFGTKPELGKSYTPTKTL